MIPMVFWASLRPWLMLKIAAEKSCRCLKKRLEDSTLLLRERFRVTAINKNPKINPIKGDIMMKLDVFMMPFQTRISNPPFTRPAPIKPPIRACEELLGRPKYHVIRFQMMAPLTAEMSKTLSTMDGLTMPVPMVFAT